MKKFGLIGAAGFIAPRHMKAIKETGNKLVVAMDPQDSVGIMDSYFPESDFFTEFERFDRHVDKLRRGDPDKKLDFMSICSPNYLHDSHIRFGLRSQCNVICEKPIVLNPWNIDALSQVEKESGCSVFTILQLRLHETIVKLKNELTANEKKNKKVDVDLTYITSRGRWYQYSWKGDLKKSGGVATNIGIHFFDMLSFLFGKFETSKVFLSNEFKASGLLEFSGARVRWFLSIDPKDLPSAAQKQGQKTYRSLLINNQEIEFSDGFTDLHSKSYEKILAGEGFRLSDARPAVELASLIRNANIDSTANSDYHPFIKSILT
jgi:UDP-N-acetyl-2-amino-2-deoxyglucuronate dehydrogenase